MTLLQLRTGFEKKVACVQGEADQPALVLRPLARNDNAVALPSLARLAILFDQSAAARAAGVPGRHAGAGERLLRRPGASGAPAAQELRRNVGAGRGGLQLR